MTDEFIYKNKNRLTNRKQTCGCQEVGALEEDWSWD